VADAIRDHYKPVGQGDDVPTAPVTVAVSLADKLDTITSFNLVDVHATGSKDPMALRRSALGIIELILRNSIRMPLRQIIQIAWVASAKHADKAAFDDSKLKLIDDVLEKIGNNLDLNSVQLFSLQYLAVKNEGDEYHADFGNRTFEFLIDRLKVQQRDAGVRHDLIDAVFALGQETGNAEDDLVRLLARVKALQAFVGTDEGANLLAGYKRAANILKSSPPGGGGGEADGGVPSSGQGSASGDLGPLRPVGAPPRSGEDLALETALDTAEPLAASAIEREDFEAAMTALASLRAPIDAFFEGVMVNDPDPDKRAYRLGLLTRFRDAVHRVADFSKIEG
jgi:glycyl-tRNA synthetase beta chain